REARSRQDDIVERLRTFEIANAERHVIDDLRQRRLHRPSLSFVTTCACSPLSSGWVGMMPGAGARRRPTTSTIVLAGAGGEPRPSRYPKGSPRSKAAEPIPTTAPGSHDRFRPRGFNAPPGPDGGCTSRG